VGVGRGFCGNLGGGGKWTFSNISVRPEGLAKSEAATNYFDEHVEEVMEITILRHHIELEFMFHSDFSYTTLKDWFCITEMGCV